MRTRLLLALVALLPAVGLTGQTPSLPQDIHPVTLSRLPPVTVVRSAFRAATRFVSACGRFSSSC